MILGPRVLQRPNVSRRPCEESIPYRHPSIDAVLHAKHGRNSRELTLRRTFRVPRCVATSASWLKRRSRSSYSSTRSRRLASSLIPPHARQDPAWLRRTPHIYPDAWALLGMGDRRGQWMPLHSPLGSISLSITVLTVNGVLEAMGAGGPAPATLGLAGSTGLTGVPHTVLLRRVSTRPGAGVRGSVRVEWEARNGDFGRPLRGRGWRRRRWSGVRLGFRQARDRGWRHPPWPVRVVAAGVAKGSLATSA